MSLNEKTKTTTSAEKPKVLNTRVSASVYAPKPYEPYERIQGISTPDSVDTLATTTTTTTTNSSHVGGLGKLFSNVSSPTGLSISVVKSVSSSPTGLSTSVVVGGTSSPLGLNSSVVKGVVSSPMGLSVSQSSVFKHSLLTTNLPHFTVSSGVFSEPCAEHIEGSHVQDPSRLVAVQPSHPEDSVSQRRHVNRAVELQNSVMDSVALPLGPNGDLDRSIVGVVSPGRATDLQGVTQSSTDGHSDSRGRRQFQPLGLHPEGSEMSRRNGMPASRSLYRELERRGQDTLERNSVKFVHSPESKNSARSTPVPLRTDIRTIASSVGRLEAPGIPNNKLSDQAEVEDNSGSL